MYTATSTFSPDVGSRGTRLDIAPIQEALQNYYHNGLAPSTHRCYTAGQQRYLHFCTSSNLRPLPTSEYTLMLFAAHLAMSGLAYTSIKVYLSSIGNWHSACSQHEAYQKALTPRLEQVLRGIKKEQASRRTPHIRLPITVGIMTQIFSVLSKSPNEYQSIMLWAASCILWISQSGRNDSAQPGDL